MKKMIFLMLITNNVMADFTLPDRPNERPKGTPYIPHIILDKSIKRIDKDIVEYTSKICILDDECDLVKGNADCYHKAIKVVSVGDITMKSPKWENAKHDSVNEIEINYVCKASQLKY
jgi:hypothetical protein